jgi:hypothetical protein
MSSRENANNFNLYDDLKFFNSKTFSQKKSGKTIKGERPMSPMWKIMDRINKRIIAKQDIEEDFTLNDKNKKYTKIIR